MHFRTTINLAGVSLLMYTFMFVRGCHYKRRVVLMLYDKRLIIRIRCVDYNSPSQCFVLECPAGKDLVRMTSISSILRWYISCCSWLVSVATTNFQLSFKSTTRKLSIFSSTGWGNYKGWAAVSSRPQRVLRLVRDLVTSKCSAMFQEISWNDLQKLENVGKSCWQYWETKTMKEAVWQIGCF